MRAHVVLRATLCTMVALFAGTITPTVAGAWPGVDWRKPGPVARVPVAARGAHATVPTAGAGLAPRALKLLSGTAILNGHVFDLAGAPLSGAAVGWIVEGPTVARGYGTTDISGAYSLPGVPAALGKGTIWAAPADHAWELARLQADWPDPGTSTFDFLPAPLPVALKRGGHWKDWPSAGITVYGADSTSSLAGSSRIEAAWDDVRDEYADPTHGNAVTLPGLHDTAVVEFWANEGLEVSFSARSGPGSRRVQSPVSMASDFAFPDHEHGWVVGAIGGSNGIAGTTDGGVTWVQQYSEAAYFRGVDFADRLHGIAVGVVPSHLGEAGPLAMAMWTADGGATWAASESGLASTDFDQELLDVAMVDATHAWAVGGSGHIYATADGGRTWTSQPSGTQQCLGSVTFCDSQHGWVAGRGEIILATTDGGATWVNQHELTDTYSASSKWVTDIEAVDASHAWAVGGTGRAFRTSDGGATWEAMHPTPGSTTSDDYDAIDFVDEQHGWLAGQSRGVLTTADGGSTWTSQIPESGSYIDIDMDSPTSGWVLGAWGGLTDTVDAGAQWGPRTLTATEASALRVFTTKPWSASGAAGMSVTLDLEQFPAGWVSDIAGYPSYPPSAPLTSCGRYTSQGSVDETVNVRVPKTATPGYSYCIGLQHSDGPLYLETAVQVCKFKSSASRVARGRTVTLSGIVPTKGHWGRTAGRAKTVYLFKRFTKRDQPTTSDPTRQGWRYVGKYRANGYGAFSAKGIKIGRATWFVALYAGDSWYWPGYTGVVKVGLR